MDEVEGRREIESAPQSRSALRRCRVGGCGSARCRGVTLQRCRLLSLLSRSSRCCELVPVVIRLVRPLDGNSEILRLCLREPGKLDPELVEVQPGHFLVEVLGQRVNAFLVLVDIL